MSNLKMYSLSENCGQSGLREFWKAPLNWLQHVGKLMKFKWVYVMGPRWK